MGWLPVGYGWLWPLETPAPPLETPWRCASKPQVRHASKPLGTNFETKIFKFRWFLGPSDQNELYHTPLLSKIWDLGDRKLFGGGSLSGEWRYGVEEVMVWKKKGEDVAAQVALIALLILTQVHPQCFSSHRGPVRPTAYPHNCPPRGSLHRRRVVHRLLDSDVLSITEGFLT